MRFGLLGVLLVVVSFAALTNTIRADQTVTVTTTAGGTASTCPEPSAIYVQASGFLILLVLIVAAVVAIFLIRLYRRTRF